MAPSDRIATDIGSSLLLTDLYQLNMLQAYQIGRASCRERV